jgi:hypothetical protein
MKAYFTSNETLALMYENTADALRRIADYIEKWKHDNEQTVDLLREIADEHEAQSMVVSLA